MSKRHREPRFSGCPIHATSERTSIGLPERIIPLRGRQPIAASVERRRNGKQRHIGERPVEEGGIMLHRPSIPVFALKNPVPGDARFRVVDRIEQQQVLQCDERVANVCLTPIDELAVPRSHQDVPSVHIAVHDCFRKTDLLHAIAYFVEDDPELSQASLFQARHA